MSTTQETKPYKHLRVRPETHQRAKVAAIGHAMTIDEFVGAAVDAFQKRKRRPSVN